MLWRALVLLAVAGLCACSRSGASIGASMGAVQGLFDHSREVRLPLRIADDLLVRRAEFGVFEGPDGAERFTPTNTVPAFDGQAFGWRVEVRTSRTTVHWQEHFQLPAPSDQWGEAASDPDVLISKDGRSAVAQGDELVEDGAISRSYWTLAAGDPPGEYIMDLAIEGHPVGHFVFRVPKRVVEQPVLVRHLREHPLRAVLVPVSDTEGSPRWR